MSKSALYTRAGDSGTTSLVGGARAPKDCPRLEAYGTLDEFSSFLGCVLSDPLCPEENKSQLLEVQNMLFNVGGYLACEVTPGDCPPVWVLCEQHIYEVEGWIDALDEATPKVNTFVLPGGCMLAARTHVARAVCRRAERRIIALAAIEYVDPLLIRYINRLSDYLFILARYFNFRAGVEEIIWRQEKK
ncbi:MAG: cob(I)yrinic acid a,c-diamide adenosyltransferase [Muribaculaceae bacterium]|nr:cob(I)yrinic acid a,c-diamide adenosyltransferase [Muribaculaceae bacterium]